MKNKTIRTHLTLTLLLFSLIITLIIAVSFNLFIDYHFNIYSSSNQQDSIDELVTLMNNDVEYSTLELYATEHNLSINATPTMGKKKGKTQLLVKTNSGKTYTIEYTKAQLMGRESQLKDSINQGLIAIIIVVFLLSLIIGRYISKGFSKPIKDLDKQTKEIEKGNYKIEPKDTKIIEINNLAQSIKKMATQIEKNIEHDKRQNQDIQHELRTPLTNIQAQIEAMLDGIWEKTDENLSLCLKELERMGEILSQLQQLDLIENGVDNINYSDINLYDLSHEIIEELKIRAEKNKQTLNLNIPEKTIIKADSNKIKSAITNLVTNAVKYSGNNTTISINYRENENKHFISIIDNGIGFPQENLEHLKERFYRVDKSRARNLGGSGLGLSIVEAIAKAHGGSLEIESTKNQETKFILIIRKKF